MKKEANIRYVIATCNCNLMVSDIPHQSKFYAIHTPYICITKFRQNMLNKVVALALPLH